MAITNIDFIPGLPPGQPFDQTIGNRTNTVVKNSMPIVKIYPGIPSFTKGQTIYRRKDYFESGNKDQLSYKELLNAHGFELGTVHNKCLTLAYQADSFPTDTFSNEYGENFLQSITNVASTAAASISQMFGVRSVGEAMKKITGAAKEQGGFLEKAGVITEEGARIGEKFLRSIPIAGGGVDVVSSMLAGGRLDFPMVWKSSNFQPSYTLTVRLYNPNPGSKESTEKYISGPIAAIMLLGIPISTDTITFNWPFIHRIWSPGIYDLDPAFISNITIIKGGDQQQISYEQRLGIVDVRIDFGSLFSSLLATKGDPRTRPTLKRYIEGMSGTDSYKRGVKNFSTLREPIPEIIVADEIEKKANSTTLVSDELSIKNILDIKTNTGGVLGAVTGVVASLTGTIANMASGLSNYANNINNPAFRYIATQVSNRVTSLSGSVQGLNTVTGNLSAVNMTPPVNILEARNQLGDIQDSIGTVSQDLKGTSGLLEVNERQLHNIGTSAAIGITMEAKEYAINKSIEMAAERRKLEEKAIEPLDKTRGEMQDTLPSSRETPKERVNAATKEKSDNLKSKMPVVYAPY